MEKHPNNRITGQKPLAKQGYSANIYGNDLVIFGGDRLLLTYNDIHLLNLREAL